MKLKKILTGLKSKYWRSSEKIVSGNLLGRPLRVINGTLRKEDYDDAWFYYLAKNATCLFDIGANIGQTSLLANVIGNVKRIVLVDPNPEALIYASKNLILNNLASNCSFFSAFVGSSNGEQVKFYTVGVGSAGSMFATHAETARLINSFSFVYTVTLDYLADYYNIIPDLVKVDVEGAEFMVLKGAAGLAAHQKTRFIIEMHVTQGCPMEQNMDNVLEWTNANGYKAFFLVDGSEITSGAMLAHRGRCHILVQPGTWEYPSFLIGVKESAPLPASL
jgi:FkbM family methyltransferase